MNQYREFYSLTSAENQLLNKKAKKLIESTEGDSEFIEKAIRFVQDDVRYLGFENGLNSHKPSDPLEVLNRRYGDCKDKSFLLSEILRAQGIEAYPMLVHSYNGKNLPESLPSPNLFDHCVVQVDRGQKGFRYIDPTISDQGGTLENIFFPDYKYGLVLKSGEKELVQLPAPITPETRITETFELDEIGGGAKLDIETVYRGSSSDYRRQEFAESSRQNIQQGYTTFYSNLYPSIKAEKNVTFIDYRDRNEFIVYEQYRIDSLWTKPDEQQNIILAEFYPLSIEGLFFPDKSVDRKMPYYVNSTTNINHKTIVFVPQKWNIANENSSFGNDDFRYDFNVQYQNAKLEITHKYTSLKDYIEPGNISSYLAEHTWAQQKMTYSLTYDKTLAGMADDTSTSWIAIILTLVVIGISSYLCYLIYTHYDLPAKVKPRQEKKIGGWLILIEIGLILTPLIIIAEVFSTPE